MSTAVHFQWWHLPTLVAVAVSVAMAVNLLRDAVEDYFHWKECDDPSKSLQLFLLSLSAVSPQPSSFFLSTTIKSQLIRLVRLLIGTRHPVTFPSPNDRGRVTLLVGALVAGLYVLIGISTEFFLYSLFIGGLLIQAFVCRDTLVLPFVYSIPLAIVGAAAAAGQLLHISIFDSFIGFAVGFGVPWALRFVGYASTGKEGVGFGVAVFGGAIGVWLGWLGAIVALVCGLVLSIVRYLRYKAKYRSITGEEPESKEIAVGNSISMSAIAWLLIVSYASRLGTLGSL